MDFRCGNRIKEKPVQLPPSAGAPELLFPKLRGCAMMGLEIKALHQAHFEREFGDEGSRH